LEIRLISYCHRSKDPTVHRDDGKIARALGYRYRSLPNIFPLARSPPASNLMALRQPTSAFFRKTTSASILVFSVMPNSTRFEVSRHTKACSLLSLVNASRLWLFTRSDGGAPFTRSIGPA